ncbi:hypothetical protein SALBM311S_02531 [Streptomyces alboniger]
MTSSAKVENVKLHVLEYAAGTLVRDALEADSKLAEYGVSPVLIGSYKRNVSIRRIKDVDVFVRLADVPADVTSKDILDRFFKVLHAEFGTDSDGHRRTKRQDRSLQVSFPECDLYVDAVPARPFGDGTWEIPQKGDALSAALQNDGRTYRIDVLPPLDAAAPLPPSTTTADTQAPPLFEAGCGSPISPTPPHAVIEAAAATVRHAIGLLVDRPLHPAGETRHLHPTPQGSHQ